MGLDVSHGVVGDGGWTLAATLFEVGNGLDGMIQ